MKKETTCNTCGCPLATPFRRTRVDGSVEAGCVAADHNGHVSDAWHTSATAEKIRQDWKDFLRAH